MSIRINLKDRDWIFFKFIRSQLKFFSVEHLCKAGKYFEKGDSWLVSEPMEDIIMHVWNDVAMGFSIPNFRLPVNSLERRPFTVLYNGKTDYADLTTLYSHWLGLSVDLDFKQFEKDTGLKRDTLIYILEQNGLFAPFKNEYWHYSISPAKLEEYYAVYR